MKEVGNTGAAYDQNCKNIWCDRPVSTRQDAGRARQLCPGRLCLAWQAAAQSAQPRTAQDSTVRDCEPMSASALPPNQSVLLTRARSRRAGAAGPGPWARARRLATGQVRGPGGRDGRTGTAAEGA